MIKKGKLALPLTLILAVALVVPVMAQEGETLPCGGEGVSGTVVAVDEETGEVTLATGGDLCKVTLDGEYDHPIVSLLGSYFGDVSADDLAATLAATLEDRQGHAVYDPVTDKWTWVDGDAEGAVAVTVVAENEDGTFTILVDGEQVTVTVDDLAVADDLREALQALAVDWDLDEEGGVVQPGDEIAAYHDDGLGFGVLVKLYAMAAALAETCADAEESCATVDDLVVAFQSGMGLGDLMKEYGKPTILGIGHVKGKDRDKPEHAGPKDRDGEDDDGLQPEDAGPKDKPTPPGQAKDKSGPPGHANAKPKKPKKDK
jgi:hypothetical protein